MSRRRNSNSSSSTNMESHEELEVQEQTPESDLKPAESQVVVEPQINSLPNLSTESIQASMEEKLSRRTDSEGEDPFVPHNQLEKEVHEIAQSEGFPLSRGTEVGARLLARARRNNK